MAFRINRLRVVVAGDAGFSDLVSALPDGVGRCFCCRRLVPDSLVMVLVAEESNDDPRALCAVVCSMCSTAHPADQLLADWAQQLIEHYGGTHVPDHRFADTLVGSG
jgi:hypothetical protein